MIGQKPARRSARIGPMILFEVCSIQLKNGGGVKGPTEVFLRETLTESSPPGYRLATGLSGRRITRKLVVDSLEHTKPLLVLGRRGRGPGELGVRVGTCGQRRRRDSWSNAGTEEAGPAI